MKDKEYMELALRLAQKGYGRTAPNPMVGAVIVKEGRIIGEGYHQSYGGLHAERQAFADCRESPRGGTLYVTLEPCVHQGKQPPCTEAIIEAGIKRVVIGSGDPNPLVAGKGVSLLRQQGIEVEEGIGKEECDRLNEVFFHYIQTGTPYVAMKYAMTLDGKIASCTGEAKWITGETARYHVQQLRNRYTAIMVGVETVLADDPLLTCRLEGGKNPIRIICDSGLRTPLSSRLVGTAREVSTIIATCCQEEEKQSPYRESGCRILVVKEKQGRTDLATLLQQLGSEGIDSILLEGGGSLNWSAISHGLVQKAWVYLAPKLLGGREAKTPIEGEGFAFLREAPKLNIRRVIPLDTDYLIEGEVI